MHPLIMKGFANNIFFIAAAYTSCAIDVHVLRPLLNKTIWLFAIVEAVKYLIK